jgi:hypothetical protein
MDYVKPTLCLTGSALTVVLGHRWGDGDSAPVVTGQLTRPPMLELGLDD